MRAIFLLISLVIFWVCTAVAAERISLSGYQDYAFGMPEADVRARIEVRKEEPDKTGVWLYSREAVQINGSSYELAFKITDASLAQMNLSRSWGDSAVGCKSEFMDLVGLITAKYGAPDQAPVVGETAEIFVGSVDFTFNDGGHITIMTFGGLSDCNAAVAYASGATKSTF